MEPQQSSSPINRIAELEKENTSQKKIIIWLTIFVILDLIFRLVDLIF
jgi:uncharacterized membrane protein YvbJ